MGTKIAGKAGYQEEVVVRASAVSTVAVAAAVAAETYATTEIEKHAQTLADAWEAKLKEHGRLYLKRVMAQMQGVTTEATDPIGPGLYQWWNLLLAGPFQPVAPGGPFLPHKIIRHGEPAFMLAALVRNPAPIGNGPTAAQIMSPFEFSIWLETINLTAVADGPDFGPLVDVFGPGFINIIPVFLNPGDFAVPPDGRVNLYEMNMTVDILGPGLGLPPFAGYSTWVLDPDVELPFFFVPGQGPRLQHDIPVRFAIYA